MSTRSRRRGTSWEREVVEWLREQGYPHAERRQLDGKGDRGDIAGLPGVVIQCKNTAVAALGEGMKELEEQMQNDHATFGFVALRRKRYGTSRSYAIMTLGQAEELICLAKKLLERGREALR